MNGAGPPPAAFVALLRCPACEQVLRYEPAPAGRGPGTFGTLTCGVHEYPYLDGVAVLTESHIDIHAQIGNSLVQSGPDVHEVTAEVRAGRGADLLVDVLSLPPPPPDWLGGLRGGRRLHHLLGVRERARRRRRLSTARMMLREDSTAQDWFEWCYLASDDDTELCNHFLCRFGQPRDLAVLELSTVLPNDDRPVLDLAAGFGHSAHHLLAERPARPVVCLDRNLSQLWVAKRHVAPGAWFVCADADTGFPLDSGRFGAAICADAFHYLEHKDQVMAELRRCAPDGPVVLARVGNLLVEPNEGSELTARDYAALAGGEQVRLVDEDTLVDWYLRGAGPQLATPSDLAELESRKWLSVVLGPQVARDHPAHSGMLHARGDLSLNPLYRDRGDGQLTFAFPSPWFQFENQRMAGYCAREAQLETDSGDIEVNPEAREALARSFVALSLPLRYLRGQRRIRAYS